MQILVHSLVLITTLLTRLMPLQLKVFLTSWSQESQAAIISTVVDSAGGEADGNYRAEDPERCQRGGFISEEYDRKRMCRSLYGNDCWYSSLNCVERVRLIL